MLRMMSVPRLTVAAQQDLPDIRRRVMLRRDERTIYSLLKLRSLTSQASMPSDVSEECHKHV